MRPSRPPLVWLGCVAVAAVVGCASDIWFKPGAGPDVLAADKTSCRKEAAASGEETEVAFERCMAAREWWHVARGSGRPVALRDGQVVTRDPALDATESELPQVSVASSRGAVDSAAEVAASPGAPASDPEVEARMPAAATLARSETPAAEARPAADPARRQFWFKWGAGNGQLERDQIACRTGLGLDADATMPSRWGQDPQFDACMRAAGWTGGSIEGR